MHKEAMATLYYPPPLLLLLHLAASERVSAWRVFACTLLQVVWAVRSIFLPVAAAIGTANLMASADTAVDVVLNSIAVAFVFDRMCRETQASVVLRRLTRTSIGDADS